MPITSYLDLKRGAERPRRIARVSPGDKHAPIVGSERDPHPMMKTLLYPFTFAEKRGGISYASFADELQKIAYVPNTPGDSAGVLRALLKSLMGRPGETTGVSTHQAMEHQLLYGGEQGAQNYTHQVQQQMSDDLLRDSQLAATLGAIGHRSSRMVR